MSYNDEEYRKRRLAEYEEWHSKTSFHPLSDWDKVVADPLVTLPNDGNYYVIANNLDEIKTFMCKLESVDRWYAVRILKDPFRSLELGEYDEDDGEVKVIKELTNIKTIRYNQFFDADERLQVYQTKETHQVLELEFNEDFLAAVTFPCLVQHSGDGGFDRGGDYEINHCQILNLTGCPLREGEMKIHLEAI